MAIPESLADADEVLLVSVDSGADDVIEPSPEDAAENDEEAEPR